MLLRYRATHIGSFGTKILMFFIWLEERSIFLFQESFPGSISFFGLSGLSYRLQKSTDSGKQESRHGYDSESDHEWTQNQMLFA